MPVADTSFVLDVLAGVAGARAKLDELVEDQRPLWLSAPTLHELYYGAGLYVEPERERRRLAAVERALPVLPFTGACARLAGTLEAERERAGETVNRDDIQIAAVALVHGEPVVSADKRFPRVDGLEVERYGSDTSDGPG